MKKVSVLVTCYNKSTHLETALMSLENQRRIGYELEVVIIDDNSSDDSVRIINSFEFSKDINVIRLFNDRNIGGANSYIKALKASSGEYVAVLDGDDMLTSVSIQSRTQLLDQEYESAMVFGRILNLTPEGELLPYDQSGFISERIIDSWGYLDNSTALEDFFSVTVRFAAHAPLYRREFLENNGWIADMQSSFELPMFFNLTLGNYKAKFIDHYVGAYRLNYLDDDYVSVYSESMKSGQKINDWEVLYKEMRTKWELPRYIQDLFEEKIKNLGKHRSGSERKTKT